MRTSSLDRLGVLAALVALALPVQAQPAAGTFSTRSLTPETALAAARAALEHCRKAGYQVGVAVVDRAGLPQVFLRDRFAGAHTVQIAVDKAWTAASFRLSTTTLAAETQAGKTMSGLRGQPRVVAAGGGLVIESAGSVVGAIAVSGAPGGDADDACAKAGIATIADALEF
ncbi:heme-binding protein [uncultured Methylibium sp.]|uniref:GlcG/HbpS family heme-binding protein n=1 Tax=uncultured Methylibium sp. TaxID=381093 RepID=UPI0025E2A21C|nr:heme-binding protein [uncultured Methylibium sp.]